LAGATLLNAYLITAITACDVYSPAHCHLTPEVIPPAMAIAEREQRSGTDLLVAVAAGLEVGARIGRGLNYAAFRARGFHAPGVIGPFGGAAAAGRLLGFDPNRQLQALGLAGSQSAGTFAAWGTATVKFHQARGALSGLLAVLLAEQGFRASDEILAHPDGGILNAYSDGGQPDLIAADLGDHWELTNISLRLWPTGSPLQIALTALFNLIAQHDLRADEVERLRIVLNPGVCEAHGCFPRPEGTFQALLSAHFVAAVVLHERAAWLDQFGPDRYENPKLLAYAAERIEVLGDPALPRGSCRLEALTRGGRELSLRADVAKGDPGNRVSREELTGKFRQCAGGRRSAREVDGLLDRLLHLERLGNLAELTSLLGKAPARTV
jgi:2-methylcitrate dehydratase PrpD